MGKKDVEASYKQGLLTDTVKFYDSDGGLLRTYEDIALCDTIVEIKIEKSEGNKIYFSKEKHKFEYKG
jgi:hypothetical protein